MENGNVDTTPPSAALTTTEADTKPAEAKPEKEPIAKPESVEAQTIPKEPVKKDPSPVKPVKPPPPSPVEPPKKAEPELPAVQTKPTQIPQPISRPTPVAEPDEHVLKSTSKFDKAADKKKDSFVEFERLQQSRIAEAQAAPPAAEESDDYQIEDEEIESIVEDILNCEEDLPEEESEKYADDDLQKKIREHLKALQEQENQFQYQTPSQILKSAESASSQAQQKPSAQLKFASEEFEDHVVDEE